MILCSICQRSEIQFDLVSGTHVYVKLGPDVTGIICSRCMQVVKEKQARGDKAQKVRGCWREVEYMGE